VTIEASASDNDGIARVEFYQGTTLVGSDTQPPYGVTWLGVPAGSYTLTARAYDNSGASATSAPVPITVSGNATLLVVGSTTLGTGDALLKARLQGLGFSVAVKASSAVTTADANGKILVVVSDTASPSSVGTKFRAVTTPVLSLEPGIFDDLGMTGTASGTDFGTVASKTQIAIVDPSHHMAGGQTGTITVATSPQTFNWGKPGAQAVKIATVVGSPTRATVFGYEKGAAMPGRAAPGRRVGWFGSNGAAAVLNAAGKELFDSAARWASGRVGL
jgi:hypothetical protein